MGSAKGKEAGAAAECGRGVLPPVVLCVCVGWGRSHYIEHRPPTSNAAATHALTHGLAPRRPQPRVGGGGGGVGGGGVGGREEVPHEEQLLVGVRGHGRERVRRGGHGLGVGVGGGG